MPKDKTQIKVNTHLPMYSWTGAPPVCKCAWQRDVNVERNSRMKDKLKSNKIILNERGFVWIDNGNVLGINELSASTKKTQNSTDSRN